MSVMDRLAIEKIVIGVLEDMTQDWDLELETPMGSATLLMENLEFESIDVVQFATSLEKAVEKQMLPFEKLFLNDGDYVDDVSVEQVVDFLTSELVA